MTHWVIEIAEQGDIQHPSKGIIASSFSTFKEAKNYAKRFGFKGFSNHNLLKGEYLSIKGNETARIRQLVSPHPKSKMVKV